MTREEVLNELEYTVQTIGLTIRYEKGDFKGGDCILYDQNLVVLNKKTSIHQRISLLARVIGLRGSDSLYLKPQIRQVVEDEMTRFLNMFSPGGEKEDKIDNENSNSERTGT